MSIIATAAKLALSLEQKVQVFAGKVTHEAASRQFNKAGEVEARSIVETEQSQLKLERRRAQVAANMIAAHKAALIRMHSAFDEELELVDGRKVQAMSKANQHRHDAGQYQALSIKAQTAAEAARKAAEQLG